MRIKISNEVAKGILKEHGLTMLEGEAYKGIDNHIKCIDTDGYFIYATLYSIRAGSPPSKFGNENIFTIENIKNYIKNFADNAENIELISDKFERYNKPLNFNCKIHGEFQMSWNKFYLGERCTECALKRRNLSRTKTHEQFCKEVFDLVGDEYTVLGEYITARIKILIKHNTCGCEYEVQPDSFLSGVKCHECFLINNVGINHPRYKATLTTEEREKSRSFLYGNNSTTWRKKVFERDNYTCQCCGKRGGTELNAHHIDGFNWCKDKRFDVNNGTTLCKSCHTEFHKLYKCGDNTEVQYNDFIKLKCVAS